MNEKSIPADPLAIQVTDRVRYLRFEIKQHEQYLRNAPISDRKRRQLEKFIADLKIQLKTERNQQNWRRAERKKRRDTKEEAR